MAAESPIQSLIRGEIQARGPISFARFMELALYCPNLGYYERPGTRMGRGGDYYTSVSVGPLFGELLARHFQHWLNRKGGQALHPGPFQLVEAGAHDGQLAHDILSFLRRRHPGFYRLIEYWIIEPSANRQKWQQDTLKEFAGKVRWFAEFPAGIIGIIFANELLDALPFRRFGWDILKQGWFEWCVSKDLTWTRVPVVEPPLSDAGLELPPGLTELLPDGFTLEFSSAAADWWRKAARALRGGRLIGIDYFLTADELLQPERPHGTARAYRSHHAIGDLLAAPGEQDLTAHVNGTHLQSIGESEGLMTDGRPLSQSSFLTVSHWEPESAEQVRQFQTLTHPEHLGHKFKVLSQARNYGEYCF